MVSSYVSPAVHPLLRLLGHLPKAGWFPWPLYCKIFKCIYCFEVIPWRPVHVIRGFTLQPFSPFSSTPAGPFAHSTQTLGCLCCSLLKAYSPAKIMFKYSLLREGCPDPFHTELTRSSSVTSLFCVFLSLGLSALTCHICLNVCLPYYTIG